MSLSSVKPVAACVKRLRGLGASRGLSPINKATRSGRSGVVGWKLKNPQTGELIEVDRQGSRLTRMRRRVMMWCAVLEHYVSSIGHGYRLTMLTLTYADADAWQPNDISAFMWRLRRRLKRGLLAYAWAAEMQQRGAVHYHVLVLVQSSAWVPCPDDSGLWPHGSSRVETARSVFYILKYSGKEYQKNGLPTGARLFAVWVRADVVGRLGHWQLRVSTLPKWFAKVVRELAPDGSAIWSRREGGGWLFQGKAYRSPWVMHGFVRAGEPAAA